MSSNSYRQPAGSDYRLHLEQQYIGVALPAAIFSPAAPPNIPLVGRLGTTCIVVDECYHNSVKENPARVDSPTHGL